MSNAFKLPPKEQIVRFDPNLIQVLLDENALLIKIIVEYQHKGKAVECYKYQNVLNRNLLYLARLSNFQADEEFLKNVNLTNTASVTPTKNTNLDTKLSKLGTTTNSDHQ